jgi:hypothetical protein
MNEYIPHIGSGIFFVLPATKEGAYIGAEMFVVCPALRVQQGCDLHLCLHIQEEQRPQKEILHRV